MQDVGTRKNPRGNSGVQIRPNIKSTCGDPFGDKGKTQDKQECCAWIHTATRHSEPTRCLPHDTTKSGRAWTTLGSLLSHATTNRATRGTGSKLQQNGTNRTLAQRHRLRLCPQTTTAQLHAMAAHLRSNGTVIHELKTTVHSNTLLFRCIHCTTLLDLNPNTATSCTIASCVFSTHQAEWKHHLNTKPHSEDTKLVRTRTRREPLTQNVSATASQAMERCRERQTPQEPAQMQTHEKRADSTKTK